MVLVVRNDLKMGKGKVAAQVSQLIHTHTHHDFKSFVSSSYIYSVLMLQWVLTSR